MIPQKYKRSILSVGPDWRNPQGGVAQVIANYASDIFGRDGFHAVINSGNGHESMLRKVWFGVAGLGALVGKLLTKPSIKVVHIHTSSYKSFERSALFMRVSKALGRKVILHMHGGAMRDYHAKRPEYVTSKLQSADAVITLSATWKKFYDTLADPERVHVVNNIISAPSEAVGKTASAQTAANQHTGTLKLLFLGHLYDAKGIFDLVEVIAENADRWRGRLHLDIGGSGGVERLKQLIADRGVSDMVEFRGWVSGEKKAELLSGCDWFILPSYTEGLPLTMLEAMSYGKPVLLTPVGAIPEVADDRVGRLFTPGDHQDMARAIDSALSLSADEYTALSDAARQRAVPFTPAEVQKQLIEVYDSL